MRYTFEKVSFVLSDKFSRLGNEESKKKCPEVSHYRLKVKRKKSNATKMVVSVSKELTVQEMNWKEEEKKHENGHCVLIDSCLNLATSWYFSALSLTVPSPNILLFVIGVSILFRLFTSNTLANQCITPNKENCGHINDINVNSVNDFFFFVSYCRMSSEMGVHSVSSHIDAHLQWSGIQ